MTVNCDERSLRDKIKEAERATVEIKRHLEHLTERARKALNRQTEVVPGWRQPDPTTMSALGRSGRAARNEVGRF